MLKQVFGKVLNKGFSANGGDKLRPGLYVPNTGFHNGQAHCAPRSFFGVEDFLDDDNSRPYTYQKGKKSKNPNKHLSFKQRTVAYMEPFTLDVFISKRFVSASLTHRVTSKQVAVAGTNSKDIKAVLKSRSDIPACLAVGQILADRAREADVYTASYTPRERDNRCNTSLVIDHYSESDNAHSYILIDVGKTFREQVLRWFTLHNIPRIDSIILTHEHADAVLGLDDIRAVQPYSPINDIDPTPIYLSHHAMDSIAEKFPYLVQKQLKPGQQIRRVAQLDWHIIEEDHQRPFVASGIQFVPLPVMHGEDYISLGFLFGEKCRVAYISDVSRIPSSTEHVISKASAGQLDILILDTDTLYKNGSHNTHFCLPQTLETVKRLCPKQALLIGMTHEFDHYKVNDFLTEWSQREGIPVQLARDGLRIPVELS